MSEAGASGGVSPTPGGGAAQGPATTSFFSYSSLKANLRKYGRTGVCVYLGLSTCVTAGFYVAIEQHFDVKKFLGIKEDPNREPGWLEKAVTGKGSTLALAMLCSKAMVPLKLPVAVAITPYVHRMTQNFWRGAAAKGL